jgi:hypothetical protein
VFVSYVLSFVYVWIYWNNHHARAAKRALVLSPAGRAGARARRSRLLSPPDV